MNYKSQILFLACLAILQHCVSKLPFHGLQTKFISASSDTILTIVGKKYVLEVNGPANESNRCFGIISYGSVSSKSGSIFLTDDYFLVPNVPEYKLKKSNFGSQDSIYIFIKNYFEDDISNGNLDRKSVYYYVTLTGARGYDYLMRKQKHFGNRIVVGKPEKEFWSIYLVGIYAEQHSSVSTEGKYFLIEIKADDVNYNLYEAEILDITPQNICFVKFYNEKVSTSTPRSIVINGTVLYMRGS